jgi:RHS repeat-associated protein
MRYAHDHHLVEVTGAVPLMQLEYDSTGRLVSVKNGMGDTVAVGADLSGRQVTLTGPDPRLITVSTYDERGNVARVEQLFSGQAISEQFSYDDDDRMVSHVGPKGTRLITYDRRGNQTRVVEPDGMTTETTYNEFNDPIDKRIDGDLVSTTQYDERGLPVAVLYPDGTNETSTFDEDGQEVSSTDRSGRKTDFAYDEYGGLAQIQTELGVTSYARDRNGRVVEEIDPTQGRLRYTYDRRGNLVAFTDGNNHTWQFDRNELGILSTYRDPLGHVRRYSYDDAGRLARIENRTGQIVTYTYTPDGKVQTVRGSDGTRVDFVHDPIGRVESARTPDAEVSTQWNGASQPTKETLALTGLTAPVSLLKEWTPGDVIATIADPHGTTRFTYGDRRNVEGVNDDGAGAFSFTYDAADRMTTLMRPNGTTDLRSYNGTDVVQQVTTSGGGVLDRVDYEYGAADLMTARTDLDGQHIYQYDPTEQLVSATHPVASHIPDEAYTYDRAGNRTSWRNNPSDAVEYDGANRLLRDGERLYQYDDEGRLISATDRSTNSMTTYVWNALDQLVKVGGPDGETSFGYDAYSNRVISETNGFRTYILYDDNGNRRLVLDGEGRLISRHVSRPSLGSALAVFQDAVWRYPVLDWQATARLSTAADGQVTARYGYDSFGKAVTPVSSDSQWHGMPHGPSGLLLAWARVYDPRTGRFLSEDPIDAPNLYTYARSSPCNLSDPTGLSAYIEYRCTLEAVAGKEWHHVVSDYALEQAGVLLEAIYLIHLPVEAHRNTNTHGSRYASKLAREWEIEMIRKGRFKELHRLQMRMLKDDLSFLKYDWSKLKCVGKTKKWPYKIKK